jgi:hypothetical protein
MPTQIFISYAHDDDLPPPESPDVKGFVTFLYEQLMYEFKQLGQPYPTLWQDKLRIADAEQFETILTDELDRSHLLLVILSNNWLARPYCTLELAHFAKQLAGRGKNPKQRIVVVLKNHIPPNQRPEWLQGQVGYSFFAPDETGRVGYEKPYLDRGKVTDAAYFQRVKDLSRYLWSASHDTPPVPNLPSVPPNPPQAPSAPLNARTIFVAKPAQDMRQAYRRVTDELVARGCTVVPDPSLEIPSDSSAVAFIDTALAQAEFSIHLLGKLKGFTPESPLPVEPGSPITILQLQRAALRAHTPAAAEDEKPPFRRLIWAPEVLEQVGEPEAAEVARDPFCVLSDFGVSVVGTCDSIVGDNLGSFLHFVQEFFQKTTPRGKNRSALTAGAKIYVYHRIEDTDYALDLALALQGRNVDPMLPAWEGDPRDLDAFHQQSLRACDKVFLCWANAPEVWVRATASKLHALGEGDQSLRRCLRGIMGPPPGSRKAVLQRLPSKDFEAVHDLTHVPKPSSDDLDPLFR